jgi:DMSO/TMAO reductase YedYZ molybdopterin-dependent catalytic subunit
MRFGDQLTVETREAPDPVATAPADPLRARRVSVVTWRAMLVAVGLLLGGCPAVAVADPVALTVTGDVRLPASLTMTDLRSLSSRTQSVTFDVGMDTDAAAQHHVYVGPSLFDVVTAAEPIVDPARRNPLLAVTVLAVGRDGYAAAVAWGEIAPDFRGTPVIIAYSEDGAPLDQPRLVVPGDLNGGRYVSGLAELRVRNAIAG